MNISHTRGHEMDIEHIYPRSLGIAVGVYMLEDKVTRRRYIGKTETAFSQRLSEHQQKDYLNGCEWLKNMGLVAEGNLISNDPKKVKWAEGIIRHLENTNAKAQ